MSSLQPVPDPTLKAPLGIMLAQPPAGTALLSRTALKLYTWLSLAMCLTLQAIAVPFNQGLNADSVAYLDIAELIQAHRWPAVVNAYWHPGYPALLALMTLITGLPLTRELQSARLLNLLIAALMLVAVRFAINTATDLRDRSQQQSAGSPDPFHAHLDRSTIQLLAASLTYLILVRDLDFVSIRPDTLLALLLILGLTCLMRICARRQFSSYAAVGLCFGFAFLVKSIAFPIFLIALVLLVLLSNSQRIRPKHAILGLTLTLLCFALVAGPYIALISIQKGRFTAGDSGLLNYAWCVDRAQQGGKMANAPLALGLAKGHFSHPPEQLTANPAIFYYQPVLQSGQVATTSPRWLDPSYWADGLKARFILPAQLHSLARNSLILAQYIILRSQLLLLLAVLLLAGGRWSRQDFNLSKMGLILSITSAQIAMYLLVALEPRYIGSAVLLTSVALLVFMRFPAAIHSHSVQLGNRQQTLKRVAVVFLGMLLCASFTESLQHLKSNQVNDGSMLGTYESNRFNAASALRHDLRVHAGDQFASLENWDFYWARLARVTVVAEADTDVSGALHFWQTADQPKLITALRTKGVRGIVARFGPHADAPQGWQRLGDSDYFVLFL